MRLKFYARDGHQVRWPGTYNPGQPDRRVGRTFVPPDPATKSPARHTANHEPAEIDSDAPESAHLIRQCRKGALWPADRDTAAACGVDFISVTQDADGEWIPGPARVSAPAPKPQPKGDS